MMVAEVGIEDVSSTVELIATGSDEVENVVDEPKLEDVLGETKLDVTRETLWDGLIVAVSRRAAKLEFVEKAIGADIGV